jgi:hypothetical protein
VGDAVVRRSPRAPQELYGATAPNVQGVSLRYRTPSGRLARRRATLIRVTDRRALRAAGIEQPFGYFIGFVPRRSRHTSAEAHDAAGRLLGRFDFDPVARSMHPTVFIARED